MTMKRTQMAAATEYTALIVSTTLASTILVFRDANGPDACARLYRLKLLV